MQEFCLYCQKQFDKDNIKQKFCSLPCRWKYHNLENKKEKNKTSHIFYNTKIKGRFPEYIFPCGHRIKLNFNPLKEYEKLQHIICPICTKKPTL
jgi:hypothetical protein